MGGSKLNVSTGCAQQERQLTAPVCVNKGMAHRPRKRIIPLRGALITLDRVLSFGPCNAGNIWKNRRKLLEGPKAVDTGVLGVRAEARGAGLLQPGEEITFRGT